MPDTIVQIYEIQTPEEAQAMVSLGVKHIGSVITSLEHRHDPIIRETISTVHRLGAVSSLIPLYTDPDAIFETLDYYRSDIVHFCDTLQDGNGHGIDAALSLQESVRRRFPGIQIMRSIPIGRAPAANGNVVLEMARLLEPVSDFFLTDTIKNGQSKDRDDDQPVTGFVGITGLTCDWRVAAQLVDQSRIPVILAGGISPENVSEGVRRVRPYGVDSCTLTNAVDDNGCPIRFKKDLVRVKALVNQTRLADG